jgi:signal peptidase I
MSQGRPWEPVLPVEEPLPAPVEEPPRRRSRTRNAVEWSIIIGGAVIVALLVKTFLLQAFYIPSGSMIPTLKIKDRVLVNKLSYDLHGVHRGDIVVFKSPEANTGSTKDLIKRVVGLPNETIEFRDGGKLYVNGQLKEEGYLSDGTVTADLAPTKVPDKHYFMMGDNRGQSRDSRVFGPVPKSSIIGRAFVRVWPLNKFRFF